MNTTSLSIYLRVVWFHETAMFGCQNTTALLYKLTASMPSCPGIPTCWAMRCVDLTTEKVCCVENVLKDTVLQSTLMISNVPIAQCFLRSMQWVPSFSWSWSQGQFSFSVLSFSTSTLPLDLCWVMCCSASCMHTLFKRTHICV